VLTTGRPGPFGPVSGVPALGFPRGPAEPFRAPAGVPFPEGIGPEGAPARRFGSRDGPWGLDFPGKARLEEGRPWQGGKLLGSGRPPRVPWAVPFPGFPRAGRFGLGGRPAKAEKEPLGCGGSLGNLPLGFPPASNWIISSLSPGGEYLIGGSPVPGGDPRICPHRLGAHTSQVGLRWSLPFGRPATLPSWLQGLGLHPFDQRVDPVAGPGWWGFPGPQIPSPKKKGAPSTSPKGHFPPGRLFLGNGGIQVPGAWGFSDPLLGPGPVLPSGSFWGPRAPLGGPLPRGERRRLFKRGKGPGGHPLLLGGGESFPKGEHPRVLGVPFPGGHYNPRRCGDNSCEKPRGATCRKTPVGGRISGGFSRAPGGFFPNEC